MAYEVYVVSGGYGVRLFSDTMRFDQPFHPYESRPMTQEEAEAFGAALENGDPIPFTPPPAPPAPPQPVNEVEQLRKELEKQSEINAANSADFMALVEYLTEIGVM